LYVPVIVFVEVNAAIAESNQLDRERKLRIDECRQMFVNFAASNNMNCELSLMPADGRCLYAALYEVLRRAAVDGGRFLLVLMHCALLYYLDWIL